MCVSPKLNQGVEVGRCNSQHMLNIAAACSRGSNRVRAIGKCYFSNGLAEFNNRFDFRIESVYVNGLVILRIRDKSNSLEPY